MHCPNTLCKSNRLRTIRTMSEDKWPAHLLGGNYVRRSRECEACGTRFLTMEQLASDFEDREARVGRIENTGSVRPISRRAR